MKKIFTFLFTLLLLSGCNYKQNRIREKEKLDSIAKVEKRNLEVKDSLEQRRIDSLSLIAWGDAKFGMSQKEALNTNAMKGSSVYKDELSLPFEKREIANNKMAFCSFDISFKSNELYRIDIKTCPYTANYIDDLEKDAMRISYQFMKKYGEPLYSLGREISIGDFNEDEEFLYKKWEIGSKTVYIQFGEVYSGSEYYYRIAITNSKFPIKKDIEEVKKEQEQRRKEKEQEKYQF